MYLAHGLKPYKADGKFRKFLVPLALFSMGGGALGKCHFLPGGGLLKIGGDQVLCLRSKGGIKRFFKLKRGITYIF